VTPNWQKGLPLFEQSLGSVYKKAGYETIHYGKWHLAEDYDYRPNRPMDPESHGFEEVFVTQKPKSGADPEADAHNVERLTRKTIAFLRRPHQRPFFCVLAHNAIHRPEMASSKLVEYFKSKPHREGEWRHPVLAAMTYEVDRSFGHLMEALNESGLRENTIVVFTADHGAMSRSDERKPWRGSKANLYEAGLRVPLLIRYPKSIASGHDVPGVVSLADLFPTLLDLSGVGVPEVELDGVSLSPWLQRKQNESPHKTLCWHFPHYHHLGLAPSGSIIRGKYKLIEWFEGSIGKSDASPDYELFDLDEDPWEEHDISGELSDVRDELALSLRQWREKVGAQEMELNSDFDPSQDGQSAEPPLGDAETNAVK
jgi:uncharacterized sulfatase